MIVSGFGILQAVVLPKQLAVCLGLSFDIG